MTFLWSLPWTTFLWAAVLMALILFASWYAFFRKGVPYWPISNPLASVSRDTLEDMAHTLVRDHLGLQMRDTRRLDEATMQVVGASGEPADTTVLIHIVHCQPRKRVTLDHVARLYAFAEGREAWLITNGAFTRDARRTWMAKDLRLVTGAQLFTTLPEPARDNYVLKPRTGES